MTPELEERREQLSQRWVATARRVRDGRLDVDRSSPAWRELGTSVDELAPTVAALLAVHDLDAEAAPSLGGYRLDVEGLGQLAGDARAGDGRATGLLRALYADRGLAAAARLWGDEALGRIDQRWREQVKAVAQHRDELLAARADAGFPELPTLEPPPELETRMSVLAEVLGAPTRLEPWDDDQRTAARAVPWAEVRRAGSDPALRLATTQLLAVATGDVEHERHLEALRTLRAAQAREAWKPRVWLVAAVLLPLLVSVVWRPDVPALLDGLPRGTAASSGTPDVPDDPARAEFVVTATELNVRSGPSLDAGVVGSLFDGDVVESRDAYDDGERTWYEVRTAAGTWGWASGRYLEPVR